MRNYLLIRTLFYSFAILFGVACSDNTSESAKPRVATGNVSHSVDGKVWQNTLLPNGKPDVTTRKTKGGLEIMARNITGTDTTIAYIFLKDFNRTGRRFLINPQDSTAFPDTVSSNFGYFGLQSILKRRQPAITLFGTSGVITTETVQTDNLLFGTYSMEVTINNRQTIITNGSLNGLSVE